MTTEYVPEFHPPEEERLKARTLRWDCWDDWVELRIDGALVYESHSIPDHVWKELLVKLGHTVTRRYHDREYPDAGFNPETGDPGEEDD